MHREALDPKKHMNGDFKEYTMSSTISTHSMLTRDVTTERLILANLH